MKELAELSNRVLDSEDEMRPEELALLAQDAISPGMEDDLISDAKQRDSVGNHDKRDGVCWLGYCLGQVHG